MGTQARWKLPLWVGLSAVLLAISFAVLGSERVPVEPPAREAALAPKATAAPSPAPGPAAPVPLRAAAGVQANALDKFLLAAPPESADSPPPAESPVKLEELRAKLPDNLYWELDAPTKDPAVLQKRAETQRKWNEVFGKIQSGDATEEEIHQYYAHRQKVSEDYLSFAHLMLSEYGDSLPDADKGLLELSIRMHQDKLKELPRQTQEALARKQLQDQRREEWIRNGKKP